MSEPLDPAITTQTFRWELVRAGAFGVLETALATFAILFAIEAYQSSDTVKAVLLGSHPVGLLVSLFIVPALLGLRRAVTRMAAEINFIGAAGYLTAALFHDQIGFYLVGMCVGLFSSALQIPLQTHWMRRNYPDAKRGQLFGSTVFIRASTSIVFSLAGGALLDWNFALFPVLIGFFGLGAVVAGLAVLRIPEPSSPPRPRPGLFQAMNWIGRDRTFRWVLITAMVMGFGVLTSGAMRVEYVANEKHGLDFSGTQVALLTSTLPSLMRLMTTFFWGLLFDRMNFILLRIILNFLFGVSLFLYFWTDRFWIIAVGAAVGGAARGGGEILWNLWVTKLAPPDHAAEYMSVHTFLTGFRGLAAPFLGFYLLGAVGLRPMVMICVTLVIIAISLLVPMVKKFRAIT